MMHPPRPAPESGYCKYDDHGALQVDSCRQRLLPGSANGIDFAPIPREIHENGNQHEHDDHEDGSWRKIAQHLGGDEVRYPEVRQHHRLLLRGKERHTAQEHERSDRQDDGADAEVGDEVALNDPDESCNRDGDQQSRFRAQAIREPHHDDCGECSVGTDGEIDLACDDAERQSESDKSEHCEPFHDREHRAVGRKQLVGGGEIRVHADRKENRKGEIVVLDDPVPNSNHVRAPYSCDRLPRRSSANTMMEKTIINPTASTRGPLLKP